MGEEGKAGKIAAEKRMRGKEKTMEDYIRQQVRCQKILATMVGILLVILLIYGFYFVNFATKAKAFMKDTKETLVQVNETMEQANATMRVATDFLMLASEKLDVLDADKVNEIVSKTEGLVDSMDKVVDQTNSVLSTMDNVAEKADSVVDGMQKASGALDGLKSKLDSAGQWLSKLK